MTLRHLKVFHTVCKHKSMTLAAKELYLTQSAVSQTIRELEEHYGTVLFERFPRRIELTETAKALDKIAADILLSYNEIDSQVAMAATGGILRVGANLSAGTALIHDYLATFEQLHPQTKVTVMVTRGSVLLPKLLENELDLVLMETPSDSSEFIVEPFYDDRIIFIGPSDSPLADKKKVSLKQIVSENLLLREQGAGVRNQFDQIMQSKGISVTPVWESSSNTALVKAVMHGRGIAVVPYLLVKDDLEAGRIREIHVQDVSLARKLSIVCHKKKHLNPLLRDFMDIIRKQGCQPVTKDQLP